MGQFDPVEASNDVKKLSYTLRYTSKCIATHAELLFVVVRDNENLLKTQASKKRSQGFLRSLQKQSFLHVHFNHFFLISLKVPCAFETLCSTA